MWHFFIMLFPCLLLVAGRELTAQNLPDELQVLADNNYALTALKMSENGRWLTAWKSYDLNQDTLLIFDSWFPGNPVAQRTKSKNAAFIDSNNLLITRSGQAELIKLPEFTSTCFEGVDHAQVLENKNLFLLQYNAEEQNKLELRLSDGSLVNEVDHVNRFYTTKENLIYIVAENYNKGFDILRFRGHMIENVYRTDGKISFLDVDPGGQGIMIHEENQKDSSQELVFLDIQAKSSYRLHQILPASFQRVFTEVIDESNVYFLKLIIPEIKQDDEIVDIWRGNDKRLNEKFYPPVKVLTYVWEPHKHFIRKVGTDQLPTGINIGSKRYFLCYDPSELQDYLTEYPPFLMHVYDMNEDRYEQLDTIAPEFFLSGKGNYALSPGANGWYLYHIPTKGKKFIEGKHLGLPWFTSDNKSILFEGKWAVWQWEINTATLTRLAAFDGYQTRIVNGQSNDINTLKGRFSHHQIDLSQPIVVELYNPEENLTGYTLLQNGKTLVIAGPATRRIQSLNYNKSLTCFSWLEENYNLPPRLVYKKTGERQTILFQSNKHDKAILSLKQDIISYANSDGIPLKGILYYPLDYDASQKYPMVVHIYQKQNHLANRYPYPRYCESPGFNIRLFLDKGYFVYLPDILIQEKEGPGLDALDCVNRSLDTLAHNPLINWNRIGLIGHSFGGYETDYIATRSNRFAAFVAGSGVSDIVWDANAFNYNFDIPDFVRIEANQYKLGVPFSVDKGLYFKNNPVYHAEKVNAPVLLWTGAEDQNVTADQTMAFYNALRRNQNQVIALFYKGEGHDLQHKQAQIDLKSRILDWFDYFLKDNIECGWISSGISK